MIVCVCNVISEHDIRQAVSEGADTVEQLGDRLNLGRCCGVCTDAAGECLASVQVNETPLPTAV
ncbi:MAG TPA: (2Fe-2S)-binding protein [Gammaproteobacteria bacterium]|nr:(2Fe-2S)-binding protein [Gammaproteobacteria bacterium]